MNDFSTKLRELRNRKGLSLRELARRSKISHPYLSQLENGKRDIPTKETLYKLSEGLNEPMEAIFELAGYESPREVKSLTEAFGFQSQMEKRNKEHREYLKKKFSELPYDDFNNAELSFYSWVLNIADNAKGDDLILSAATLRMYEQLIGLEEDDSISEEKLNRYVRQAILDISNQIEKRFSTK